MKTMQAANPLKSLLDYGQSIWLDYVRRNLLTSGELAKLIKEDGLRGMTSNPSIFEKAIGGSEDYDTSLQNLFKQNLEPADIYERLAIEDIQMACDIMKPVYEQTKRHDGYVSLEVSPHLAFDTKKTIAEARRLWQAVARPNVMIKVPGTPAGIPALEALISEGININVTLLFSKEVYQQVAQAYIKGLENFAAKGGDVSKVASVASFFISRIDSAADQIINERIKQSSNTQEKALLQNLVTKVAIANARLTYQLYKQIINEKKWQELAKKGAMPQRLLWASTSTKNPQLRDVLYIEQLIGPDTVNTIPPATYDAFRNHGQLAYTLESNLEESFEVIENLEKSGISLDKICSQLVDDGVKLFADAFDKLMDTLKNKRSSIVGKELNGLSYQLNNNEAETTVKKNLEQWKSENKVKQLWSGDTKVWTGQDEDRWLGWLGITYDRLAHLNELQALNADLKKSGFKQALLIGMGGSSLGPAVLASAFGKIADNPELHVLDSTVPEQIKSIENKLDLSKTIFIVSSKSGSTLEPNIIKDYFFEKVKGKLGAAEAGKRFIAITDPGSSLEQIAKAEGFRHIFYGLPSIGGRYSILSAFGIVPAAIMGIDLGRFLEKAELMVQSCSATVPPEINPGVLVGTILGAMANIGRDKITFIVSPKISDLGAWLEQLLAESTGKIGKGIIPVDGEDYTSPVNYGKDRLFIYIQLENNIDPAQEKMATELEKSGQPVVRIALKDTYDIAQEFFRFEFATAVAGSIMGINPFNQPDVEASKLATRNITNQYEKSGSLTKETPVFSYAENNCSIELFADQTNWQAITKNCQDKNSLKDILKSYLSQIRPQDYVAVLAYLEMNTDNNVALQKIRNFIHRKLNVATCLGFGPRYLHSTGQVYKGGPNTGIFLHITADDTVDMPVPGKKYTFSVVKMAQALGDIQVLIERKRRVMRIHLKGNLENCFNLLQKNIEAACMEII